MDARRPGLRRLLALAAPFSPRLVLAVALGAATVGSSIGLMTTAAYLLSRAALHPSIAELQVAIVGVRFFGIARGGLRYLERVLAHDATFRLLARIRVWLYRAVEPLAPARLQSYRSGDLLARMVADVETLQQFFLRTVAPPAAAVLVALLAALLVGWYDPRLAAVLLAFLLLGGLALPLGMRALGRRSARRLVQVRAEVNSSLVEGIQGLAELLAFGQEQGARQRVERLGADLAEVQGRLARQDGLHSALNGLLANGATLAVLGLAVWLVRAGRLDGVTLGLLALAAASSFEAVLPLAAAVQALDQSLEAGRRLFEIADAAPAVVDPAAPLPLPPPGELGLRVEGLRFRYDAGGPPALDGIDFTLARGGRLAVTGPSGAGKSTLAGVLLRFWDYPEGSIRVGGRELREVAQEEWRGAVAVVSQRTHLFNASVRENLLLARPEASEAEMVEAAEQAQIHGFIRSLPEGYDTLVGEQGLKLSAGQRQRLALARALLKKAPFLVLDEPTANLDPVTERAVLGALLDLMAGRTTLIITHRLAGLESADEILVLRAGRIVERGRHGELLEAQGLYRRMWEAQHQVVGEMPA